LQYLKEAVLFYSAELGEYPYNTATVVQGPESFGGGMEYPTITVISPMSSPVALDQIIAHEVGHNWFQGVLASNEREHPWMDEGMNSYYEKRYLTRKYGNREKNLGCCCR
jgi:aminopeptidase N